MQDGINLFGKIVKGKLELNNKGALVEWLKNQTENSDIVVKVRNQDEYYTQRQLRLLYREFREISHHTGYTVEEVKTMLKMHCGLCYVHTIETKEITQCKSISDLNKKEISNLIEQTDIWAFQRLGMKLLNSEDLQFLKDEK